MNLILILFIIVAAFILLLFLAALKIKLVFDSDKPDINVTLLWLNPFIRAAITMENYKPVMTLFLFNKKILKRTLEQGKNKHNRMELIKQASIRDVHVNTYYGFRDPFSTGIACGALNIASQFINIDSINNTPDFMASDDYIYFDANAKLNIGSTLIKLLR